MILRTLLLAVFLGGSPLFAEDRSGEAKGRAGIEGL